MLNAESFLLGMAAGGGGGGGGGNPNYVETISGTLENPWGTIEKYNEIHQGLVDGTITARISWTSGFIVRNYYLSSTSITSTVIGSFYQPPAFGAGVASRLVYQADGAYSTNSITVQSGGTWVAESFSSTTLCTLTIIHHPMP